MHDVPGTRSGGFPRRRFLAGAAAIGAIGALPAGRPQAAGPLLARPIPRSGELIPVIGLGTAIVFDIGADPARRAERREVLRTLAEDGARLIDTAPSYGSAEDVLGELIPELGIRDKIFLATKVRAAGRDETIAEMRRSLERLRTARIDLMQLHNVSDPALAATQLGVLRDWRERGTLRYTGITHFQAGAYERLAGIVRRERPDFLQLNYSLAERGAEQALLPLAADTGTAVLVNLPFGRGRLFSAVRGRPLPEWAAAFAESWGQFFLKFVLSHPAVTCVIPGTDKPGYMRDNLGAGRAPLPDAATRRRMIEFWEALT